MQAVPPPAFASSFTKCWSAESPIPKVKTLVFCLFPLTNWMHSLALSRSHPHDALGPMMTQIFLGRSSFCGWLKTVPSASDSFGSPLSVSRFLTRVLAFCRVESVRAWLVGNKCSILPLNLTMLKVDSLWRESRKRLSASLVIEIYSSHEEQSTRKMISAGTLARSSSLGRQVRSTAVECSPLSTRSLGRWPFSVATNTTMSWSMSTAVPLK